MKRVSKKLICCVLCVLMMMSVVSVSAFAQTDDGISTYSAYTSDPFATLSISSGTAKYGAVVKGTSSVTKIVVVLSLQKYTSSGWSNVVSTTTTVRDQNLTLTKYYSVSSGYTYRTKAVITIYVDSNSETVTKYATV